MHCLTVGPCPWRRWQMVAGWSEGSWRGKGRAQRCLETRLNSSVLGRGGEPALPKWPPSDAEERTGDPWEPLGVPRHGP